MEEYVNALSKQKTQMISLQQDNERLSL